MAEFIYCRTRMSEPNTNFLMNLISSSRDGQPFFKNHDDLCKTIDATELGDMPWQKAALRYRGERPLTNVPEWMTTEYEIFYREPRDVARAMLANPTFDGYFDYVPYQDFDRKNERRYENLMSGDWAWKQAVGFYPAELQINC